MPVATGANGNYKKRTKIKLNWTKNIHELNKIVTNCSIYSDVPLSVHKQFVFFFHSFFVHSFFIHSFWFWYAIARIGCNMKIKSRLYDDFFSYFNFFNSDSTFPRLYFYFNLYILYKFIFCSITLAVYHVFTFFSMYIHNHLSIK